MKMTVIPIVIGPLGIIPKGIDKETGRLRNKSKSGNQQNYYED